MELIVYSKASERRQKIEALKDISVMMEKEIEGNEKEKMHFQFHCQW